MITLKGSYSRTKRNGGNLFIETALFLDAAAYKQYKYFFSVTGFDKPDVRIRDLMLRLVYFLIIIFKFIL